MGLNYLVVGCNIYNNLKLFQNGLKYLIYKLFFFSNRLDLFEHKYDYF